MEGSLSEVKCPAELIITHGHVSKMTTHLNVTRLEHADEYSISLSLSRFGMLGIVLKCLGRIIDVLALCSVKPSRG